MICRAVLNQISYVTVHLRLDMTYGVSPRGLRLVNVAESRWCCSDGVILEALNG